MAFLLLDRQMERPIVAANAPEVPLLFPSWKSCNLAALEKAVFLICMEPCREFVQPAPGDSSPTHLFYLSLITGYAKYDS
jgi:hypothetical protein